MSEFINTADVIGDDEMCDQIIQKTVTEYKENRITKVGDYAFYGCTALSELNIPNVTEIGRYAFYDCYALTEIDMPNLLIIGANAFRYCKTLSKVITKAATLGGGLEFYGCSALQILDILSTGSNCWDWCFNCASLQALVVRSSTCSVLKTTNALCGTPIASGAGYIYVPSALLADYQAATNWSTYADQFRALEDYTVDGTTTGDLDESKI